MLSRLTKSQKKTVVRLIIATSALAFAFVIERIAVPVWYIELILFLPSYAIIGYDILYKAFRGILTGSIFDENFLMAIATIGAFCIGEYAEGVAVMLFYQLGELFQSYAVGKSRKSIAELMDIRPNKATIVLNGKEKNIHPDNVKIGEIFVVKLGEKVPLDGVIVKGESYVNTSALTGESMPSYKKIGEEVLSGSININGLIFVECKKVFHDSTASKILDMLENASDKKSTAESFITKFARYYTPAVVIAAVLIAIIPPYFNGEWSFWIHKALAFLVVSCPCALVISVPLSFFGGIGGASRKGVLIKGGNYMEQLSKVSVMAFDKTGTLTKGSFEVVGVYPEQRKSEILKCAAIAESSSNHPIAVSIVEATKQAFDRDYGIKEISGEGVVAAKGQEKILVGNSKLLKRYNICFNEADGYGTIVYVAKNGEFLGYILLADTVKEGAHKFIAELNSMGIKAYMFTGDNKDIAKKVAESIGIEEYEAELLPGDKIERMERVIKLNKGKGTIAFVGDGINDAPVLMRSDIGIAMGGIGSDSAIEAADIVLMQDKLSSIITAIKACKKTMKLVYQNIVFALSVKLAVMVITTFFDANMWLAVFADVGVTVIAIMNAMRAMRVK